MATIKEIAKESGVSIATVSNIMHGKPGASDGTRKKVLDTIKKLNYTPNLIAQNLKQKKNRTIGIITEDLTVFNTPKIVDGINEYCDNHNYQFVLGNLRLYQKYNKKFYTSKKYYNHVEEEFRMMKSKQVEGIIYIGCHCRDIKCIPNDLDIPIITSYVFDKDKNFTSVIFNDEQGAYDATEKLIKAGHDKIGVIAGIKESIHTQERLLGYQRALYENQILFNPRLIFHGDWDRESGIKAAKELIENGATALFSMNDVMAGGVYDYLDTIGKKVGRDISLVGFDNRELSIAYNPMLSTMELPLFEIGGKSAELLIKLIEENDENISHEIYRINCRLIDRKSICIVK